MNLKAHKITMLGTGLIGDFYTKCLHEQRGRDSVGCIYSRTEERAKAFATRWNIPHYETDMKKAIEHPDTDVVVIGLPNDLHLPAVEMAAAAGKAVLCTKPLGRTAVEGKKMLDIVEKAGVFHGYLEDLAYTPKALKSLETIKAGALGKILWVRSREAHPGPHSDWFWDLNIAGGGAIVDLGCHCIEIARNYIGKDIRPVEVMCWADTLVKPIEAEDNAIGLVRYENGAIGQFEVSWSFRGGMDLRDEISGDKGIIRLDHFLRTGFDVFTDGTSSGYIAEKAESNSGWLFPVGDEVNELGYNHMFTDMLDALDNGTEPMESFYDGYIVNAVMDAAYKSAKTKKWEPIELEIWKGQIGLTKEITLDDYDDEHYLIKTEILPDGRKKLILKNKFNNEITQRIV